MPNDAHLLLKAAQEGSSMPRISYDKDMLVLRIDAEINVLKKTLYSPTFLCTHS